MVAHSKMRNAEFPTNFLVRHALANTVKDILLPLRQAELWRGRTVRRARACASQRFKAIGWKGHEFNFRHKEPDTTHQIRIICVDERQHHFRGTFRLALDLTKERKTRQGAAILLDGGHCIHGERSKRHVSARNLLFAVLLALTDHWTCISTNR